LQLVIIFEAVFRMRERLTNDGLPVKSADFQKSGIYGAFEPRCAGVRDFTERL
jgi:hypothetical protein